jgi:hypothetical protein
MCGEARQRGEEGAEGEKPAEEPAEGEEGGEEAAQEPSALEQGMNLIDAKAAQDFLSFNGDFSAEVKEEEAKLNLNAFFTLSPVDKNYDRLKSILYHLLATPEFQGLFEDRYRGAQELAQNIADYIDKDEVHNEPGGEERGREIVRGQGNTTMKNGKALSLEELTLVPGMTEAVFQKLKEYVTIYGPDDKVWVCRAKDPLVRALVLAYSENNPKMEPIKDDNEEMLKKATDAVLNNCPDLKTIAKELDLALGVVEGGEGTETQPTPRTTTTSKEGQTTQETRPTQKSTSQSFTDLVKEKGVVFGIDAAGLVGESEVKVITVVDTSQGDPKQWKQLFWRVE